MNVRTKYLGLGLAWCGIGLLTAAGLPGCKQAADESKAEPRKREVHKVADGTPLKFAFVTNNASDFWKLAAKGVDKFTKEHPEVKVELKAPPTGTVQEQNKILDDLVSQGYNGIAVSAIAPEDQVRQLNKVAAATNLISHDSDAPKSNRLVYIGTDNYEAGKALGAEIVKLLPQGGKLGVFVGTFSADNAHERLRGIEDAIKGQNITVAARKEDNKDTGKARSNVDDVLNAQGDINLLVGLWSYNGPQIAAAISGAGKKGKVLAAVFDEEDGTLDGIEKGIVNCTVVQKPFQFGYRSSQTLYELATKGESALPKEERVDTKVDVVNAENVKDFREKLAEMKK